MIVQEVVSQGCLNGLVQGRTALVLVGVTEEDGYPGSDLYDTFFDYKKKGQSLALSSFTALFSALSNCFMSTLCTPAPCSTSS